MAQTVRAFSPDNCIITDISGRMQPRSLPPVSNLTSRGIPKAKKADPLRTREHIQMMMDYFHDHSIRDYAMFVLGINIGLRASDILNIRVCDVVNSDGTIRDDLYIQEKKTRKMNNPVLNDMVKDAIAEYLNTDNFNFDDYLFSVEGRRHHPMSESNMYKRLKRTARKLGLPYNVGTHTLRKTFAYWTIKLHQSNPNIIYSLMDMLNHSDLKSTLHYSGQTRDDNVKMYNDMGGFITGEISDNVKSVSETKLDMILDLLHCDE